VYDEIADELRGLIDEERGALDKLNDTAKSSGDERRADITQNTVTEKHMQLDLLPSDLAGQVKGLENYDFQSAEAHQRFDDLMDQLREQLMQSQLDQMAEGVSDMSPEDLQRMKDMFAELNTTCSTNASKAKNLTSPAQPTPVHPPRLTLTGLVD